MEKDLRPPIRPYRVAVHVCVLAALYIDLQGLPPELVVLYLLRELLVLLAMAET